LVKQSEKIWFYLTAGGYSLQNRDQPQEFGESFSSG